LRKNFQSPTSRKLDPQIAHEDVLRTLSELEQKAPDEASRMRAAQLRVELSSPAMMAVAKDLSRWDTARHKWWYLKPVLRYHEHIVWPWMTIIPGVVFAIAAATNVWWVLAGDLAIESIRYGAIFTAATVVFCYLATRRRFSVSCSSDQVASKAIGRRYAHLRTGTMPTVSLRDVKERRNDRVLELHDKSGLVMEIPMQVDGYDQMHVFLKNMASTFSRR
jgi:hypothetical protein